MSKKAESPNEESRKIKFEFNKSPRLFDQTPFERLERKENQGYPKVISKPWPEPRSHVPQPTPHTGPRPQKDARLEPSPEMIRKKFRSRIPRKIK